MPSPSRTQHAVTHLRSRLHQGLYRDAGQLPSEHALAKDLGVSRCIVRNALGTLIDEGLIQRLPGMGCIPVGMSNPTNLVEDAVVVFGAPPTTSGSSAGYLNAVNAGAIAALQGAGKIVLVMDLWACPLERCEQLLQNRPAGVIVGPEIDLQGERIDIIHRLAAAGAAVVICSDDAAWQLYDRVIDDQETGAYLITRHLLACGRRRIALMAPAGESHAWWEARQRGYARAMVEAGSAALAPLPSQPLVMRAGVRDPLNLDHRIRATTGWLAAPLAGPDAPDAVIAVTDGDVFPLLEAARQLNRPLAVAGYDHYWTSAWEREFVSGVPLATIDKDNLGIGHRLAQVLATRRSAADAPVGRHLHPPCLIITPAANNT